MPRRAGGSEEEGAGSPDERACNWNPLCGGFLPFSPFFPHLGRGHHSTGPEEGCEAQVPRAQTLAPPPEGETLLSPLLWLPGFPVEWLQASLPPSCQSRGLGVPTGRPYPGGALRENS